MKFLAVVTPPYIYHNAWQARVPWSVPEEFFISYVHILHVNSLASIDTSVWTLKKFPGILSFECQDIEVNSDMSSSVLWHFMGLPTEFRPMPCSWFPVQHTNESLPPPTCAAGGTWFGCGWRGVGDGAPLDCLEFPDASIGVAGLTRRRKIDARGPVEIA